MLQRVAVTDLGTNSLLYLHAQREPGHGVTSVHHEMAPVRLGVAARDKGVIQESALAETITVLHHFKELAESVHADRFVVVGTYVFRKAQNRNSVCEAIRSETGLSLEILSESDEAKWSYWGAVHGRSIDTGHTVIDIGGGSTEIIHGDDSGVVDSVSLELGAVTLTKKWIKHDPPQLAELNRLEIEVAGLLRNGLKSPFNPSTLCIGVGGTGTTLAALALNLQTYVANEVDGFYLDSVSLKNLIARMAGMTLRQRRILLKTDPERADIILAGALILKGFLIQAHCDRVMISDRGLRYGIALREFGLTPRM